MNLNIFSKKYSCYYVLMIFSSQHVLETSFDVYKVKFVCLFICRQLSVFPNNPVKVCAYKVKSCHALSHEQFFSKHCFLDIFRCAFKVFILIPKYIQVLVESMSLGFIDLQWFTFLFACITLDICCN